MQPVQVNSCCHIQKLVEDPKKGSLLMKGQEQNPEGTSVIIITQREVGTVLKVMPALKTIYKMVYDQK